MQNIIFNTACRAVLVGALLLVPVTLKAGPPITVPGDVVHESTLPDENSFGVDDIEPCVYQFWNMAWDLDFVLGQSGMLLESSEAEAWQVLVVDTEAEESVVAEGSFLETERLFLGALAIPQEELDEAGIISYDHYVVAGLITGSTGVECALYGLATEVVVPGENPDDEPIVTRSLAPMEMADDVESAAAMAYDAWEAFGFAATMAYDDGDTFKDDPTSLMMMMNEERDDDRLDKCDRDYQDCKDEADIDFYGCLSINIGCIGAIWCPPAMAACIAALSATCSARKEIDLDNCMTERDLCEG